MRRILLLSAIGLSIALSACTPDAPSPQDEPPAPRSEAADQGARDRVLDALKSIAPDATPDLIRPSELSGFYEVVMQGRVLYISVDGRQLIDGRAFEISSRKDLGETALAEVRRGVLSGIPTSDRIIFEPENPKYRVAVFTDVTCGYCQHFHAEIEAYNAAGIAVDYIAFPRGGVDTESYKQLVDVWCAADRKQALTQAKQGTLTGSPPCANPVAAEFEAGLRSGLQGTPMILAEDGTSLGGYLTPQDLLAALDLHSSRATAAL